MSTQVGKWEEAEGQGIDILSLEGTLRKKTFPREKLEEKKEEMRSPRGWFKKGEEGNNSFFSNVQGRK